MAQCLGDASCIAWACSVSTAAARIRAIATGLEKGPLVLTDFTPCPGTQGGLYLQTLKMRHNNPREQDFVPALKQTFKQPLIPALSRHW